MTQTVLRLKKIILIIKINPYKEIILKTMPVITNKKKLVHLEFQKVGKNIL